MGIIVHLVTTKLPHPQVGSNSGIDIYFEPQRQATLECPPEVFETPLDYYGLLCTNDVRTIIWLSKYSLSSFAPPHEHTLTVQFPVGW